MVKHLEVVEDKGVEVFNNNKHKGVWIVLYHANWCYHCVNFIPVWKKLQSHLKKRNVNCASIESEVISQTSPHVEIMGYPSIHLLKDGKLRKVYKEKDREIKTILKFIGNTKKHSKKKKISKKKRSLKK